MGKITVKHFLNKKVKPILKNESEFYPLYLQIIYSKFSTERRSETGIFMTDSNFEYYLKFDKLSDSEIIETKKWNGIDELKREIEDSMLSIEVIEKYQITVTRSTIFNAIKELSRPSEILLTEILRNSLHSDIWEKTIFKELIKKPKQTTTYEDFLLCFDGNIIDSINEIESYTGLKLSGFIKESDIVRFQALQVINTISDGKTFAEFILSDYDTELKRIMNVCTLELYEVTKSEINNWMENAIDYLKTILEKMT